MEFTVRQIASIIEGEILGDDSVLINQFNKIEEGVSGGITFLSNPKYESFLYTTKASAIIVSKDLIINQDISATLIKVNNPYLAISTLMEMQQKLTKSLKTGIENPVFISDTSIISDKSFIGAFSYVSEGVEIGENTQILQQVFIGSNVKIGKNTVIKSGVKIYNDCIIGDNCTIHSGVIIGSDGFGFAPKVDGTYQDIPQLGNVVIENNVNIGSNSTIDRATMGSTIIRKGVKLDNLVQVAHNVEIGENTVIAAQTGIAGSTKIGKNCVIAGQVGIAGHIKIADFTKVGGQTGVNRTIKSSGKAFAGTPMQEYNDYLKTMIEVRKLPDLVKKIDDLNNKILE